MKHTWLVTRAAYVTALALAGASVVVLLARGWSGIAAILNSNWPIWVNNVANVSQIGLAIAALVTWCAARITRSALVKPTGGPSTWLLASLALLLPPRDRDRFVREVTSILADYEPRQRLNELLSVAAAVPGLAVILRWARRRRA